LDFAEIESKYSLKMKKTNTILVRIFESIELKK